MKSRGEPISDDVFKKKEPKEVVFFRKGKYLLLKKKNSVNSSSLSVAPNMYHQLYIDFKEIEHYTVYSAGIVGDWKNNFSVEVQAEMDQWIKKNLTGTDLSLSWALAE